MASSETLEKLVIEWRDAREAILSANWSHPTVDPAHKALWTRLGHAEDALMTHARMMERPICAPAAPRQDLTAIHEAIDTGGGQTCDVEGVIKALKAAGFEIVRIRSHSPVTIPAAQDEPRE